MCGPTNLSTAGVHDLAPASGMDWAASMTAAPSTTATPATPAPTDPPRPTPAAPPTPTPHLNEVVLLGRVSAEPDQRDLPSGDRLVTFRLVVDRPPERGTTKRAVDVIDVACWAKGVQRSARSLAPDDVVRVEGALRRRFFATGGGRASRYEVEARRVSRVSRVKVQGPGQGRPQGRVRTARDSSARAASASSAG